jgi:hypothetical protein
MWLRLAIAVSTERADLPKSGRFVQSESGHPTIPLPMLNCLVDGSHIDGKLALPPDLVQLAEQLARQWTPAGNPGPHRACSQRYGRPTRSPGRAVSCGKSIRVYTATASGATLPMTVTAPNDSVYWTCRPPYVHNGFGWQPDWYLHAS